MADYKSWWPGTKVVNDENDPVKAQLIGRNAADLAGRGLETATYLYQSYSQGQIPAGATITLVDLPNVEAHLEALTVASDANNMSAVINPYLSGGTTISSRIGIPNATGAVNDVFAQTIQENANGENDFFKVFVYDEAGSKYVWGMKRQAVFNSGMRINIKNWDGVNPHNAAILAMVSVWR